MKQFIIILSIFLAVPQAAFAARTSPVDNGVITSGVGWRVDPFGSGRMVYHNGYDISVPVGTPVHATQAGTVYFAGPYKGYGNLVVIEHGEGYVTLYGHNEKVLVQAGEKVDATTVLALSGNTGRSTGPHVHYEIRQLPRYAKVKREQLEKTVRGFASDAITSLVDDYAQGKGGGEVDAILPSAPDE